MRNILRAVSALAVGAGTLFVAGCSGSSAAQCVRSTGSKICYVRDNDAGGSLDVSGLDPGSTLTISSKEFGVAKYVVGTTSSVELTVTGTSGSKEALVGTFNS